MSVGNNQLRAEIMRLGDTYHEIKHPESDQAYDENLKLDRPILIH